MKITEKGLLESVAENHFYKSTRDYIIWQIRCRLAHVTISLANNRDGERMTENKADNRTTTRNMNIIFILLRLEQF